MLDRDRLEEDPIAALNRHLVDRAYVTAASIVLIGLAATVNGEYGGVLAIGGGICVAILGRWLAKADRRMSG
jgi:hypothetical protein